MSEKQFTEDEKELLRKYQALSTSSLGGRLAVETIPPLVFIGVWLFTGRALYLLALIAALVGYNIFRILKQHKNLSTLNSISRKVIGEASKVPPAGDRAA